MPPIRILAAAAALAFAASSPLHAADLPANRPITLIVPFAAGGGVDGMGRLLAERLRSELPQGVVVENKPGASGMLGAAAVVRAAPDGATLLLGSAGETAINPLVFKAKMQYQPEKDLAPIALIARVPNVLVANPNFPANTVAELIDYLKKNPDKVTFASSGTGSSDHLTAALFLQKTGTTGTHVPYKGGGPAINDLMAGHANVSFQNLGAIATHVKSGKLKALGVAK